MESYITKLREKIGRDKFIHPAARIIVENDEGEVLFIERADNGNIGLPAGALEENETIEACIIREVKEETGIEITALEVIGISTDPRVETVRYPNGDEIQYFTIEFYSNSWKGNLHAHATAEVKKAAFRDRNFLKGLPGNEQSILESLEYYRREGRIKLG
ncbi:MAG: NUDIX domain-containing protein [Phaeodactylibacter sp.]|nr:NUDIX domain-containing protein [Phaeodactylibacter sp.]MCB9054173.1 NUDIX domain-containing protein [Lewinellaceae bacterium]